MNENKLEPTHVSKMWKYTIYHREGVYSKKVEHFTKALGRMISKDFEKTVKFEGNFNVPNMLEDAISTLRRYFSKNKNHHFSNVLKTTFESILSIIS